MLNGAFEAAHYQQIQYGLLIRQLVDRLNQEMARAVGTGLQIDMEDDDGRWKPIKRLDIRTALPFPVSEDQA